MNLNLNLNYEVKLKFGRRQVIVENFVLTLILYTALLWQKDASDKCEISCNSAKCVCHFH